MTDHAELKCSDMNDDELITYNTADVDCYM